MGAGVGAKVGFNVGAGVGLSDVGATSGTGVGDIDAWVVSLSSLWLSSNEVGDIDPWVVSLPSLRPLSNGVGARVGSLVLLEEGALSSNCGLGGRPKGKRRIEWAECASIICKLAKRCVGSGLRTPSIARWSVIAGMEKISSMGQTGELIPPCFV